MSIVAIPTHDQELLVRSALDGPVDGAATLAAWATAVDFDDLDGASQRIIPLLYKSHDEQPNHPEANRMKGLYKRAWMRNQITRHRTLGVLTDLEDMGIDAIVMKGLSLSVTVYRDSGARPMADADILVAPGRYWDAHDRLLEDGWNLKFKRQIDPFRPDDHGASFVDDRGMELDLHYSLFSAYGHGTGDRGVWDRAVPIAGYASSTRSMSPGDELLLVIVHGLQWDSLPPIRWIPDGVLIMRHAGASIDWDTFVSETVGRGLVVPISFGLATLADYGASVPESVVDGLAGHRPTRTERYEFWARQQELRAFRTPTDYLRAVASAGERASLYGFLRFVSHYYALQGPRDAIRKLGRGAITLTRMVSRR